jgi:hypothetical protein
MFELTGALPFVLPIMIAVTLAKQVADMFGKRGIYETWIHLNGYPHLDKVDGYSRDVSVREIMTKIEDLVVITSIGATIDSLSTSTFALADLRYITENSALQRISGCDGYSEGDVTRIHFPVRVTIRAGLTLPRQN